MKKKINILFFGLGSIGQRHLRNLKKLLGKKANFYAYRKTKHVPLLDDLGNKIKGNVEKKFRISLVSNLNLVKKYNINLIFITNPTSFHINTVLKLKKLKNVYIFIEKPIDSSFKKKNIFLNFIRKNNINVFVGYNMRFHPGYIKLKEILKNKKIFKKIYYAIFKCGENIKDYHRYEDYKISYAAKKNLGGGVCLTNIHEIDMMLDLFGKATLLRSYKDKISKLRLNVEDFSFSMYKNYFLGQKLVSMIILDFFQTNKERYIKIIAEEGEIFLDFNNYFLKIIKKGKTKTFNFMKNKNSMYINELKLLLNFFKNKKKIPNQYNEKNAFESLKLALKIKK